MRYLIFLILLATTLLSEDKVEIKRTYYESGELSSETRYINGKKDGEAKQFYPNGQIRKELLYKNGKDVSIKIYYPDGSIRVDIDNQQKDIHKVKIINHEGKVFVDHEVHKDPNDKNKATLTIKEKEYTTQFKTEKYEAIEAPKIIFKDDPTRKDGEIIEYNKDGDIENFAKVKDGKLDGEAFRDYGTYKSIDNYENGKLNGMRKRYKNGVLIKELEFKDNAKSGIFREYYDDGTLKKEAMYEKNKLTGEMVEYREDGSIKMKLIFGDKKGGTILQFDSNKNLIKSAQLSNFSFLNNDDNKSYRNTLKLFYPNSKPYMDFNLSKGDGKLTIYYPTGELKYTIPIKKYKAQGEAKKYYKNSNLRAIIPLSKDKIDGTLRVYYPNGNSLKYILPYKENSLSGTKIKYDHKTQKMDYNISYRDGALDLTKPFAFKKNSCGTIIYYENQQVEYNISCKKERKSIKGYYQNGMMEYEINYKKGKKEGLSYLYYGDREFDEIARLSNLTHESVLKNSVYQELKFTKGKLNGESKTYKQDGELIKEINYKNGLKEGLTTQFGITNYGNKPTTTKTEYKDDKKDGTERYYEEGELKRETQYKEGKKDGKEMRKKWKNEIVAYYKNDKKHGFETKYDKDSNIIDGKEYRDGKIVYEIEEVEQ